MKGLLLAGALVALAFLPVVPLAAAEGPCPQSCTPPEPCGWAPDIRKYPLQWVAWARACVDDVSPVLP